MEAIVEPSSASLNVLTGKRSVPTALMKLQSSSCTELVYTDQGQQLPQGIREV